MTQRFDNDGWNLIEQNPPVDRYVSLRFRDQHGYYQSAGPFLCNREENGWGWYLLDNQWRRNDEYMQRILGGCRRVNISPVYWRAFRE